MQRFHYLMFCLFLSCISHGDQKTVSSATPSTPAAAAQPNVNADASKKEAAAKKPEAEKPPKNIAPPKAAPQKSGASANKPAASAKQAPEATKPASAGNATVNSLVDAIQRQYNSIRSSTFDFEQSYKHPFMNVTETSKGTVAYQKLGGKMVWSYLEPKERQKKFYVNGNKLTYYSASDKIAYTHDCYDRDTLSASVAFLLGSGNLKASFVISPSDGENLNQALTWLTLVPNEKDAPVKRILLGVNKEAKVMESVVEDPTGGKNHFKFHNFKVNPKIASSVFVFVAPEGVTVQPMPNVTCPAKSAEPAKKDSQKEKVAPEKIKQTTPKKAPSAQPKTSG